MRSFGHRPKFINYKHYRFFPYAKYMISIMFLSRQLYSFGSWCLHTGLLRVWQLPLTYCFTYIKTWLNGSCQTISNIPLDSINQTHLILVVFINTAKVDVRCPRLLARVVKLLQVWRHVKKRFSFCKQPKYRSNIEWQHAIRCA